MKKYLFILASLFAFVVSCDNDPSPKIIQETVYADSIDYDLFEDNTFTSYYVYHDNDTAVVVGDSVIISLGTYEQLNDAVYKFTTNTQMITRVSDLHGSRESVVLRKKTNTVNKEVTILAEESSYKIKNEVYYRLNLWESLK